MNVEKQEPAAWKQTVRGLTEQCFALIRERDELQKQVWLYEKNGVTCQTYRHTIEQSCSECNVHQIYSPPPQREWVGLTDEERRGLIEWQKIQEKLTPVWAPMMLYLYEAIEAKLKEKNNG